VLTISQVQQSVLPTGAATAAKQPALGTAGSASTDVITIQGIASGTPVAVSGTITANIGTAGTLALDATLTGGTQQTKLTDGTNVATVKAASTAAVATDKALVVAISPNNTVPVSLTSTTITGSVAVTGTVTANIGTSGSLALDASVTGLQVSQGSTTSGQKGGLSLGAVTTGSPTYTTAQTSPLSLTTAGALRVDASATTQPVSGTVAISGTVPVSGTVAATQSGTWTVQPGNTANTVAWKVDGSAVTQPISGSVSISGTPTISGTVTANIGTSGSLALDATVSTMSGKLPATLGQKVMASSLAVAIASDQSAIPASQSGTWTVQPGNTPNTVAWKVDGSAVTQPVSGTITANIGTIGTIATQATLALLPLAQGSTTSGQSGPLMQGAVATASPTYTSGQTSPLSLDTTGALRVNVTAGGGGGSAVAQGSTTAGQSGGLDQAAATLFYPAYTPGTTNPLNTGKSGALRVTNFTESDAGSSNGFPWILSPETSEDFSARVSIDNVFDQENFCYTAQNTGKHTVDTTTMTVTYPGTGVTTNGGSITTANTGAAFSTRRFFPCWSSGTQIIYFKFMFTGTVNATNTTIDFGCFQRPTSTPYAPTDGAYFRLNSSGMFGVANNAGTETLTSAFATVFGGANFVPTSGVEYDGSIYINPNVCVFWLDMRDGNGYTSMGRINSPAASGRPFRPGSCPFSFRHAIGGSAASGALSFKVIEYGINMAGQNLNQPWLEAQGSNGNTGSQGAGGQTQGSTANLANNQAAGAGAAMTNTTAALGTGLGGQFACLPTLTVGTDGIVCDFTNPAGSSTVTGRTLAIDSIKIEAIVTTALTGGPVLYNYSAAWGHTATSLATAESANTKAPRRKPLSLHAIPTGSAIGFIPTNQCGQILTPDIFVQPGEHFAICAKNMGTVTTAGVVVFLVTIVSHWCN